MIHGSRPISGKSDGFLLCAGYNKGLSSDNVYSMINSSSTFLSKISLTFLAAFGPMDLLPLSIRLIYPWLKPDCLASSRCDKPFKIRDFIKMSLLATILISFHTPVPAMFPSCSHYIGYNLQPQHILFADANNARLFFLSLP